MPRHSVLRVLFLVAALAAAEAPGQSASPSPQESAVSSEPVSAERLAELYQSRSVTVAPPDEDAGTPLRLPYRLLAPARPLPGRRYPLVLFLHGAGERGDDPQPGRRPWTSQARRGGQGPAIHPRLSAMSRRNGLERGGPPRPAGFRPGGPAGRSAEGVRHRPPPICGGGERIRLLLLEPAQKEALKTLLVKVFHGGKDGVVPLEESQRMVDAFRAAGSRDISLTVYPDAGHDSWSQTYSDAGFFPWLLSNSR